MTMEKINFFLLGKHSHRTPLSYADLSYSFKDFFNQVFDLSLADIIVLGFQIDLSEHADLLAGLKKKNPSLLIIVLSEEPLWDVVWSVNREDVLQHYSKNGVSFEYIYINHFNSNLYDFKKYPYFILTSNDYLARYRKSFLENKKNQDFQLIRQWSSADAKIKFYMEKRYDKRYSVFSNSNTLIGLSEYRTKFADCFNSEVSLKVGLGWGDSKPRQTLIDWHFEKLYETSGNTFLLSAIENTLCRNYITEKIFDAYAVCAYPVVYFDDEILDKLPVFKKSSLNLHGQDPIDAYQSTSEFSPDLIDLDHYRSVQSYLCDYFSDFSAISIERIAIFKRLRDLISKFREVY